MKTPKDPRHINRQEIVKALYAEGFIEQPERNNTVKIIIERKDEINEKITNIAPEFPIDKINKVDLAILQLGVYEIMIERQTPEKVVLDEAIELAKEFGSDSSAAFINGALGKLVKDIHEKNTNI